jgi:hypothetical protein
VSALHFMLASLFGLFFAPENVDDIFLRNVGLLPPNYMAFIPEDRTLLNHPYKNLKSYAKKKIIPLSN